MINLNIRFMIYIYNKFVFSFKKYCILKMLSLCINLVSKCLYDFFFEV